MKNKTPRGMKDPRLDRIFSDAYRNTIKLVADREKDKYDKDYYKTFSELFEQELYNRDLTAPEREEFMSAFRLEMESLRENNELRGRRNRKILVIGGPAFLAVIALSFSIYLAAVRPFMSAEKITTDLDYYLGKVEDGYGSYAKKFYRLVDKRGGRLNEETETAYRAEMYATLDDHFDGTIGRLEAGEIRFYDDAKDWASRFPEAEERTDRKEAADNAFKKGLGAAVDGTLEEVKEGAKNFFRKAADFIKDVVKRE